LFGPICAQDEIMSLFDREAFLRREGSTLVPTDCARSPWDADALHGRVIIGVLGAEIERQHGEPSLMPARFTVDLYRAPRLAPFEVVTRVVREGRRIKVVDAELLSEGRSAGRASCQLLRRTTNPPGQVWSGAEWDAPPPADIPDPGDTPASMHGMWSVKPISGELGKAGQRRLWMREVRALVAGEPLTPFSRLAVGVDYASPITNSGDEGVRYINSDVTAYLHRLPAGEWVGYESVAHGATDGVAVGSCHLYDEQGRIGWAGVCALGQSMDAMAKPSI
jgi:hypothetical protein